MSCTLLICGASARAAAFSALRANLRPCCADLFADADLSRICPVQRIPVNGYPQDLLRWAEAAPPGPWLYTGALENRPGLVRALAGRRPLWGNDDAALARARSPRFLAALLAEAGLPSPAWRAVEAGPPVSGRWLVKPLAGSGGSGVHFFDQHAVLPLRTPSYYQEFLDGEACAALYVGDGRQARLLGATRQLVGEPWLHAAPFHYCGSIGPLPLAATTRRQLAQLGDVLARGCNLRGLFGVDGILHADTFRPVEINPRYTASVEVLELAQGLPFLTLHQNVFAPTAVAPRPGVSRIIGKAILFAADSCTLPPDGPWRDVPPFASWHLPSFADIPHPGEAIAAGKPILTIFAQAANLSECADNLRARAAAVYSLLCSATQRSEGGAERDI